MREATRFALVVMIFFGMVTASSAQSVMKQCGEQWQAAKQAGSTNGETWPQFLKECRARLASTTSAPAPTQGGFAPAAPAAPPSARQQATPRRRANATLSTPRTRLQSERLVRRSANSWRPAEPAMKRSRKRLQLRPQRLPPKRSRRPARCSLGNSPPRPPPRRQTMPIQPRQERANSLRRNRRRADVRERRWSGSTKLAHLPLRRNKRLRQHQAGRVHVRGRCPGGRQSRCEEREPSVGLFPLVEVGLLVSGRGTWGLDHRSPIIRRPSS